jgi:endonuclease YncB( thermonuclease family)
LALGACTAAAQDSGLQAIVEEVFPGRVTDVSGPGLLSISYGGVVHQFQLDGIRAQGEPSALADLATALLRERLIGKSVQVRVRGFVEEGKVPTGIVLLSGADPRVDLVGQGLVLYCPRHVVEAKLVEAERVAKGMKRGLWADPAVDGKSRCDGAT